MVSDFSSFSGFRFSDPAGADWLGLVGASGCRFVHSTGYEDVSYPPGVTLAEDDEPFAFQVFGKAMIFRKQGRPLEFDGDFNSPTFVEKTTSDSDTEDGLIPCPDSPFGLYFRNRLAVLNKADSPTTVIFSDLLDSDTFSRTTGEFFLNKGTSDETRALAPYLEDQVIVFNRRSIHLINGIATLDSSTYEVTRQYGMAGNRAWAQSGPYTYFVSNEGDIQILTPQQNPAKGLGIAISKVASESIPLSRPNRSTMEQVSRAHLGEAQAVAFNGLF